MSGRKTALPVFTVGLALGVTFLAGQAILPARATPDQASPPVPAYIRRGDEAEVRYQAYRARVERLYEKLSARLRRAAPDLERALRTSTPKPVRQGYQVLPTLLPDAPPPRGGPVRLVSGSYSWPRTEQLIQRESEKADRLEAALDRLETSAAPEPKGAYEPLMADYRQLAAWEQIIHSHVQYNRLWQQAIARDKVSYDRGTVLHDAVLERQAIADALGATDEAAFRAALGHIKEVDRSKPRDAMEQDLRDREAALTGLIRPVIDQLTPFPFVRVEQAAPRRFTVRVPFYTDIEDAGFVASFKAAIERIWHLRDSQEEFGVELSITSVPAATLYSKQPGCGEPASRACLPPGRGDKIDLHKHIALFPPDAGVLTTGATTTHVLGRAIVLGPHDLVPHVLAHEVGHILGFGDAYFRGYRDLAGDGYQVLEIAAEVENIMGAPGGGPVLRRHFEALIRKLAPPAPDRG